MRLLSKYLFNSFSSTFFPIFWTLYVVTSIVFLVKIASLTSVIQINFIELLKLYFYSIPHILFYTLPISYFVGLCLSIARLSSEDELIVITSFGLKPSKVVGVFLPVTIVVTTVLLIVSLGLRPKADYLKDIFLNIKKQEAQFNIKTSEYGQQIGKWLVYVSNETNGTFQDITLLQIKKDTDNLISANFANIQSGNGALSINLKDGRSFAISQDIQQVDFEKMTLNYATPKVQNIKSIYDIMQYWDDRKHNSKRMDDFNFRILISSFPLISLFFVVIFGFFNPRYSSNKAAFGSSIVTILFIILASKLAGKYPQNILYILPLGWGIFSYIIYYFTTKRLY